MLDYKNNIEENIKIEICNIFDYLMNWREDFYLDNLMKFYLTEKMDVKEDDFEKIIRKILPVRMLSIN